MVTLQETISPAIGPVVEPVVEDTSTGYQKVLSKMSLAKSFGRTVSGISTSGISQ